MSVIKIQSKIFKNSNQKIKKLKNEISNIIWLNFNYLTFNTPISIIALKGTCFFKYIKRKIFNCVTIFKFKF